MKFVLFLMGVFLVWFIVSPSTLLIAAIIAFIALAVLGLPIAIVSGTIRGLWQRHKMNKRDKEIKESLKYVKM